MADLLGQLFAYTDVFDMETRPELILLQKSMVIVEGVARGLDPSLNLWSASEPVAAEWVQANYGARGAVKKAGEGATTLARVLAEVPTMLAEAERASVGLSEMARNGVRLMRRPSTAWRRHLTAGTACGTPRRGSGRSASPCWPRSLSGCSRTVRQVCRRIAIKIMTSPRGSRSKPATGSRECRLRRAAGTPSAPRDRETRPRT